MDDNHDNNRKSVTSLKRIISEVVDIQGPDAVQSFAMIYRDPNMFHIKE